LTYFCKTLKLSITCELIDVQSSLTTMFLLERSINWNQHLPPNDIDLDIWPTLQKTLASAITYELLNIELSNFTCVFLVTRPFQPYQNIWPLYLNLWPTEKNPTLIAYYQWTDRVLVFDIYAPFEKVFLLKLTFATKWPWPLTYLTKNLNLVWQSSARDLIFDMHMFLKWWLVKVKVILQGQRSNI